MTRLLQRFVDPSITPADVSAVGKRLFDSMQKHAVKVWPKSDAVIECEQLQVYYKLLQGLPNTTILVKGIVDTIINKDSVTAV